MKNTLKPEEKEWIEKSLNALPYVYWDRFIENPDLITVYGWIYSPDHIKKDFIVLEFDLARGNLFFVATSSEKRSKDISEILGSEHTDCLIVRDNFKVIKHQYTKGGTTYFIKK